MRTFIKVNICFKALNNDYTLLTEIQDQPIRSDYNKPLCKVSSLRLKFAVCFNVLRIKTILKLSL